MTEAISNSRIAREVLESALPEWREDLDYFKNDLDGSINFIFQIDTAHGPSIIYYNPQSDAEKIVEACVRRLEGTEMWKLERYRERFLKSQAGWGIRMLLVSAPLHFEDALWELPLAAITQYRTTWSPSEVKKQLVQEMLKSIYERKKKRFAMRERGRPRVIDEQQVYFAVEHLGGAPSQRKVSELLEVSEKALREWRKSKGFHDWKAFLESVNKQ
jgi:hypothetical protein